MHKMIPVAGPSITDKEIAYVTDAIKRCWYEDAFEYINKFENNVKKFLNRKYAISLPSCTSALHLSLIALGVGVDDEVIVPDATWIASAAPITYVGAKPIFADIDERTWCLSAKSVKKLITDKTKAIIAVNLYGHMPEYDDLLSLGIPVIEDAAESIGSTYKGRLSGTFGATSCFSFHGSKTLTTGEGGMLVTDDDNIYDMCMIMRDHGRNPGDILFQNIQVGYKYKMSNIQAALGLAQLERIDELVQFKRKIFSWYQEAFRNDSSFTLNPDHPDVENSYWMTTLLFMKSMNESKFDITKRLLQKGISTRPFFSPLSSLKAYIGYPDSIRAEQENRVSYEISSKGINLPSSAVITQDECLHVADAIRGLYE